MTDCLIPRVGLLLLSLMVASTPCAAVTTNAFLGTFSYHTIAKSSSDNWFGWGANTYGQLGIGDDLANQPYQSIPDLDAIQATDPIIQAAASGRHSMVLTASGKVYGAGGNSFGELGLPAENVTVTRFTLIYEPSETFPAPSFLACGALFSMLVTVDGELYVTGRNTPPALGLGDSDNRFGWEKVGGALEGKVIVQAFGGRDHAMVLTDDGVLYGSGSGTQMGHSNSNVFVEISVPVDEGDSISSIWGGFEASFASTANNKLFAWGKNDNRQLLLNITSSSASTAQPADIVNNNNLVPVRLQGGSIHTGFVTDDNRLLLTGADTYGQLGHPVKGTDYRNSLYEPRPDLDWAEYWSGSITTFAATTNGDLYTCGYNQNYAAGRSPATTYAVQLAYVMTVALDPPPSSTPTVTPTSSPSPSETPSETATPSETPTSSLSASSSETATSSATASETATSSASTSETPTSSASTSETPTSSASTSETPTSSASTSETPTNSPSPSQTPSETPTSSETATQTPSSSPSPSATPTASPSAVVGSALDGELEIEVSNYDDSFTNTDIADVIEDTLEDAGGASVDRKDVTYTTKDDKALVTSTQVVNMKYAVPSPGPNTKIALEDKTALRNAILANMISAGAGDSPIVTVSKATASVATTADDDDDSDLEDWHIGVIAGGAAVVVVAVAGLGMRKRAMGGGQVSPASVAEPHAEVVFEKKDTKGDASSAFP